MTSCSIGIGRFHANRWITRMIYAVALALLGGLAVPQAHAQVPYTYTGTTYTFTAVPNSAYSGKHLSISLIPPIPFAATPPGTMPIVQPCPVGTIVMFNDGVNQATISILTGSDPIAASGLGVYCSVNTDSFGNITAWDIVANNAYTNDFINGEGWQSFLYGVGEVSEYANATGITVAQAGAPGTWKSPTPSEITAALLSQVTAMNLTSAAASLTDQIAGLELVENLPGKSLACLDLKAIQANVASLLKHGTITQTQANTINPWVVPVPGYIATSLGCH
jgi:hypothetical protein